MMEQSTEWQDQLVSKHIKVLSDMIKSKYHSIHKLDL